MRNHRPQNSAPRRLAALLVAVSLLGAGCGPGAGEDSSTVDNFPKENITLTIWRASNDSAGFADAINEYTHLHKNVSFVFKIVNPATYEQDLIEALAAGKGPDIVTLPNDKIHAFEDKLAPMPANFFKEGEAINTLTARYPQAVVTDTYHDGKIYGIPLAIDALILMTNRSLGKEEFRRRTRENLPTSSLLYSPPIDWNEVIELTKLLTKREGDQFLTSAIALGTTNNVPHASDIIAALMLQQGVKMVSADGKNAIYHLPDLNDSTYYPGPAVLDFLSGFSDPTSDHYTWNASQPDAVQAFIDGKLAMMIGYQSSLPYINQRNPGLEVKLSPLPQIPNARTIVDFAGNYRIEAVNKASPSAAVAWDFLATMVDDGLSLYSETVGQPSAVKRTAPTTTVGERANRSDVPRLLVPTSKSWYKGSDPDQADRLLTQSLDRVIGEGQNARLSLTEAAAVFTQLLSNSP
jgi:ABC-type glycerol-3-phosphate transport system substrate-binding protein